MAVDIIRDYPGTGDTGDDGLIRRCAEAVLTELGIKIPVEVTVMLTDDANIKEINRQTRQIDEATDVLSFPLLAIAPDDPAGAIRGAGQEDTDPETGAALLGDIVICLDAVNRQAGEYGHSRERELGYLTVHGMLHLLGYDHMEEDKARMRRIEEQVMDGLELKR